MSERYPHIRRYQSFEDGERSLLIRECVSIAFYMRCSLREMAQAVWRAVEVYRNAVGPQALGWYADDEGEWQELDEKGWEFNRRKVLDRVGGTICLSGSAEEVTGYEVRYHGRQLDHPRFPLGPDATSSIVFYLPTEYLEEHGPERVRELALELASGLPFSSGHAGLSFLFPEPAPTAITRSIRDDCFRHPGLDIPSASVSDSMGARLKGVYWLNFLAQPVLGALGGVLGIRSQLPAETTVRELEGERALMALGRWPEAGDLEQGRHLPAYRELARVLEPWLYEFRGPARWSGFSQDDMRRWARRFLD
ncbi:MAG TPA: type VI immunity family protein [Archangium sp.]|nr:type VI immunity family protein [Archangium sp.]